MAWISSDCRYLVEDLRRLMVRLAANEGWFQQSWLGIPVWQLADDLIRLQHCVVQVQPTWIIETGTKFGGSAIFFASLLSLINHTDGGVITIDTETYPEAIKAFTEHQHGHLVKQFIQGNAADLHTVDQVRSCIQASPGPTLVFLDDNHNKDHVSAELDLYSPLVTVGSYLIVADTVYADLAGTPVGQPTEKYPDVSLSNPRIAVDSFLTKRDDFKRDLNFDNGSISNFSDGFLQRIK